MISTKFKLSINKEEGKMETCTAETTINFINIWNFADIISIWLQHVRVQ